MYVNALIFLKNFVMHQINFQLIIKENMLISMSEKILYVSKIDKFQGLKHLDAIYI